MTQLNNKSDLITKEKILDDVKSYFNSNHKQYSRKEFYDDGDFIPGVTPVPYAGRVFDESEMINSVSSLLDFWLTLGKNGDEFQRKFAEFLNVKFSVLTNSGSSANLLALSALTSYKLGDKRLKKGDEVITVAAGFPTILEKVHLIN